MELGTIFSITIENKIINLKYSAVNDYCHIIEMITEGIFNPNKITLELVRKEMRGVILSSSGVFIQNNFLIPKGSIKKRSLIFALTTTCTVQFKPSEKPTSVNLKGFFITATPSAINSDVLTNYFIIFK
jgi:hypothetical protein